MWCLALFCGSVMSGRLPSLLSASSWDGWSPLEPQPWNPLLPLLTQGKGACFQDVLSEDQDVFFSGVPRTPFCLLGLKCVAGPSPTGNPGWSAWVQAMRAGCKSGRFPSRRGLERGAPSQGAVGQLSEGEWGEARRGGVSGFGVSR